MSVISLDDARILTDSPAIAGYLDGLRLCFYCDEEFDSIKECYAHEGECLYGDDDD